MLNGTFSLTRLELSFAQKAGSFLRVCHPVRLAEHIMPIETGSPYSKNLAPDSNRTGTGRVPGSNNIRGSSSHCIDLLSLQPDPDLVQLFSAPPTPRVLAVDASANDAPLLDADSILPSRTYKGKEKEYAEQDLLLSFHMLCSYSCLGSSTSSHVQVY